MSLSIFSPNSKITGGALFAEFNSKEGDIYIKLIKQIANNPDKKNNFDGKNPITVKLTQDEVALIIYSIRTKSPKMSFVHKFNNVISTTGYFSYYNIPSTEQGKPNREGFGLTVKKDGVEIKVGISIGAAEKLMLYFINALYRIFDSDHADDIKRTKEYSQKNKLQAPQETGPIDDSSKKESSDTSSGTDLEF